MSVLRNIKEAGLTTRKRDPYQRERDRQLAPWDGGSYAKIGLALSLAEVGLKTYEELSKPDPEEKEKDLTKANDLYGKGVESLNPEQRKAFLSSPKGAEDLSKIYGFKNKEAFGNFVQKETGVDMETFVGNQEYFAGSYKVDQRTKLLGEHQRGKIPLSADGRPQTLKASFEEYNLDTSGMDKEFAVSERRVRISGMKDYIEGTFDGRELRTLRTKVGELESKGELKDYEARDINAKIVAQEIKNMGRTASIKSTRDTQKDDYAVGGIRSGRINPFHATGALDSSSVPNMQSRIFSNKLSYGAQDYELSTDPLIMNDYGELYRTVQRAYPSTSDRIVSEKIRSASTTVIPGTDRTVGQYYTQFKSADNLSGDARVTKQVLDQIPRDLLSEGIADAAGMGGPNTKGKAQKLEKAVRAIKEEYKVTPMKITDGANLKKQDEGLYNKVMTKLKGLF